MEQNTLENTPVHTVSDIENNNFLFKFKGKTLDLSKKTHVMGIMNITPDSFSDGNQYKTVDEYLFRIEEMLDQGADIIDLGAESTRPGSKPVTADEELERLLPVLEQAISRFETIFSVDTTKSLVAKQALERGVSIINDISGLSFEPEIGRHIANHDAGIILMHTPGRPDVMQELAKYDSILPEIISSLTNSISIAESFGINFENIIVDPGIGFGKTVEQNLEILRNLSELLKLRRPILIGTSRKSFIGKLLGNIDVNSRIEGSSATVAASILNGASFVRVHDVNEMKKVVRITDAIQGKN
jgi:dihydropteroate synthase